MKDLLRYLKEYKTECVLAPLFKMLEAIFELFVPLVIAVIISTVIAIATPPIPGGGAVGYTVLFAQMGIPMEALAIALTIDIITDFIITAFEMLALPLSLVNIAASLGMIDEKILKN